MSSTSTTTTRPREAELGEDGTFRRQENAEIMTNATVPSNSAITQAMPKWP